jgi:hypothetical protein
MGEAWANVQLVVLFDRAYLRSIVAFLQPWVFRTNPTKTLSGTP